MYERFSVASVRGLSFRCGGTFKLWPILPLINAHIHACKLWLTHTHTLHTHAHTHTQFTNICRRKHTLPLSHHMRMDMLSHTHDQAHTYASVHILSNKRTQMHTNTHKHTHTHTALERTHRHTHTYKHTYAHTHKHTRTHTHTHTHTHRHTDVVVNYFVGRSGLLWRSPSRSSLTGRPVVSSD